MRFLVVPTPLHGGEVHCVHVSPDNSRVLTCGKDGVVAIWPLETLVAMAKDGSPADGVDPVLLSQHAATACFAQWNPCNSHSLISADVQGNVYLWTEIQEWSARLVFSYETAGKPTHAVSDGGWSPDGRLFAWATTDSKIHIYDMVRDTYQELTALQGLAKISMQNSIAFDPSGNFLVSMGTDTLVYMYQYHYDKTLNQYQFKILSKISDLVHKTSTLLNYKRISWSADGELASIPIANKGQSSVISLISRSHDWQNNVSLVGHDIACEVVRFGPNVLCNNEDALSPDFQVFHVIASAGSDKCLVFWNTTKDTPICIVKDFSKRAVVDICWDRLGNHVFAASLDGHLTIVSFDPLELGKPVDGSVKSKLAPKEPRPFSAKPENDGPPNKKNASQIELLDQKDAVPSATVLEPPKVEAKEEEAPPKETKHIKEHLKEITPSVIPPPSLENVEPDILHSAMSGRPKPVQKTLLKSAKKVTPKSASPPEPLKSTQEVMTKNGKKRIQPILLSNSGSTNGNVAPAPSTEQSEGSLKTLMEFEKASYSVPDNVYKDNKRFKSQGENPSKKTKRELEPVKFVGPAIVNPNTTFARMRLAVPKVRLAFRLQSRQQGSQEDPHILDIKNGQGSETVPSRVTYFKKEKQIWCDFVPRFIQLATEGLTFWALSTTDGQILTYSLLSGKRLLPPLVLGSPLAFLESYGQFLMAVTAIGELYVWDMDQKRIHLHSPLSLVPLLDPSNKFQEDSLSKADNLTMCSITSRGIPLVTLSNGSGYLFNKELSTWQTITESWWAFGSHYWDSLGNDTSSLLQSSSIIGRKNPTSLIGMLEHKTNEEILRKTRVGRGKYFNKISKNMVMKEGFENLENTISLSHLENRILCSELLGETSDFCRFLVTYAKRVCELGLKAKLIDICTQLWTPLEESKICGVDKHELLKEIVVACAVNRDSQRILIHYSKKLGLLELDA